MTELLDPAPRIRVRLGPDGSPAHLESAAGWQPVSQILDRWRIDCDWWRDRIAREYWRLLLDDELALECYQDHASGDWFIQRIYD